jgi:outer membrane protein TolC
MIVRFRQSPLAAVSAITLLLSACANFSPDGGMSPVQSRVAADLGKDTKKISSEEDAKAARERIKSLLASPLTADSAVQVALLNNRGLQARYNALGISEAGFVEAGLLPNPTLSFQRLSGDGFLEIERRLAVDLLSLLTLPFRRDIAERQFRASQYRTIDATFRVAAEARRAYYSAIAANQVVGYLEKARLAADAAADLNRRLGQTGAASKLSQARTAAFYAEISNQLARARLVSAMKREALTRALGVWGEDSNYKLPDELPPVPDAIQSVESAEADALQRRVDLIAARTELDATAAAFNLTDATRFISILEVAGISQSERSEGETTRSKGFEVAIQIPIFDFGEVSARRAKESYMAAVNRLLELAVNIRSEARSTYFGYRAAYDISREYQTKILPLRRTINEETLLQYNGMLIDAFELLTTSREGIASNIAAIEAIRDFHLAEVDFRAAIIGGGVAAAAESVSASATSSE